MTIKRSATFGTRALAAVSGVIVGAYAGYAAAAWLQYGRPRRPSPEEKDELLDLFMPAYEVAERHALAVAAPADTTFAASMDMDLGDSPVIRAIFRGREILLGAEPDRRMNVRGLVAATKALGWGVLAEVPNRAIVMGAVTQPWKADVEFVSLPPDQFAAFDRPGFVKIAWTLRADPHGPDQSVARTETRVMATDAEARRRFRRYWASFSAGIVLIREISIRSIKREAERRARIARERAARRQTAAT